MATLCGTTLEAELTTALCRLASVRDRKLLARHLGWDGGLPCSLSEAGAQFRITRERARQVYAAAIPVLRRNRDLPALRAVLEYISQRLNTPAARVQRELVRRGLTHGMIRFEGILSAARLFGCAPRIAVDEVGGVLFLGTVSQVGKTILSIAVKSTGRMGIVRFSDVRRQLSKYSDCAIGEELIREILQTRPDLEWLDEGGEWFWLSTVARNRLLLRIEKVLAVHRKVHFSVLYQAVLRDRKLLPFPQPLLRSLCGRMARCRVYRHYVEAYPARTAEEVLSGAELIVHDTLRARGGVLPLNALEQLCFARGVKLDNFWRLLGSSPIIRRVSPEVYGLVGASA